MRSNYLKKANSLPHFSGYYRQRSSGFGTLAAPIVCAALPLACQFILLTAELEKNSQIGVFKSYWTY